MKPFHRELRVVWLKGYGPYILRVEWAGRCRTFTWGKK